MLEKRLFDAILKKATHGGLRITYWDNDTRNYGPAKPYCHLHIKSPKALRAIFKSMTLGFGESYTSGLIDITGDLGGTLHFVNENQAAFATLSQTLRLAKRRRNVATKQKSYIAHHYDLGNDFYKLWLDKNLLYSCAYFKSEGDPLEQAQMQKIHHILRKLQLKAGDHLLDIGSGWGTLLITAVKEYGVIGHGITLSEEQLAHCKQAAGGAGLEDKLTFELAGYQELPKRGLTFDKIVSVGMFEHVGRGNHKDYYRAIDRLLKPGGISVLHTITQQIEEPNDPWIDKYIFPGGYIPSNREITHALPTYDFRLIDYENLRIHYAMTLEEWMRRYEAHKDQIIALFDEPFYRMWHFWLACSAASFRYGPVDLSQYVFTKGPRNDLPLTRDFLYTT